MHLSRLKLRDFRNYVRLDAEFGPGCHVLLGNNAQGKTNILEAVYLLATLRSFRGCGGAQMIRQGAKGYFVGGSVVGQGVSEIKAYWSPRERKLSLNERPIRRLADYFGVLRAVVFCSEDLALVKGPAQGRRRFLDLLLAQTVPGYLTLLMRYAKALRSRNALLKQALIDLVELDGFTLELVQAGEALIAARREFVPALAPGCNRPSGASPPRATRCRCITNPGSPVTSPWRCRNRAPGSAPSRPPWWAPTAMT